MLDFRFLFLYPSIFFIFKTTFLVWLHSLQQCDLFARESRYLWIKYRWIRNSNHIRRPSYYFIYFINEFYLFKFHGALIQQNHQSTAYLIRAVHHRLIRHNLFAYFINWNSFLFSPKSLLNGYWILFINFSSWLIILIIITPRFSS